MTRPGTRWLAALPDMPVLDEEEIASALLVRDTLREGEWGRTRALLASSP